MVCNLKLIGACVMKKLNLVIAELFAVMLFAGSSFAQDATVVDPDH